MAHTISSAIHSAPAAEVPTAPAAKTASPIQKTAPVQKTPVPNDTVQISTAAQTALQESRETPAQTAKEAASGDRQAQKLLTKENAAKRA